MHPFQSFNQINDTQYGQQSSFLPFYPVQNDLFSRGYNTPPLPPNRQFVNNPMMDGFRQRLFGSRQGAGERRLVNVQYTEYVTVNMINTESVLPQRKRRQQHFPQSSPQYGYQGYANPLSLPPFLYNCPVQPAYLPPLPPPLPHFASYGFGHDRQYQSNPSTFYPVTPNWQTFPSMIPQYPHMVILEPSPPWNQPSTTMPYQLRNPFDLPPRSTLIMDEYIDKRDVRRKKDRRRKSHKRKAPVDQFVEPSPMTNANPSPRPPSGKLPPVSEIPEIFSQGRSQEFFDDSKNTTYSRPSYYLQTNGAIKNTTERNDSLRDIRLSLAKRDDPIERSPGVLTISSKDEEKTNSSTYPSSSRRSESKTMITVSMIESDMTKKSFSTFRPNSRSTQDTNIDTISLASGIKSEKDNGNYLSHINHF